jgi:hypothetical protein
MRKILFFATFVALALTSSVWAADISGTWRITQKNNEGVDDSFDVAIKATGDKLTITGNHAKIGALSGSGTLKGDKITMTINAEGAQGKGALSFAYTGKVSGNEMSGTKDTKMSGTPGSQGGLPAVGGQASAGGQAPAGGQGAPSAAQGGARNGAPGGAEVSNAWTAVKK